MTAEWEVVEEVAPLDVRESWCDADGTEHTWDGALLGPGYLSEARDGGRAR